MSVSIVNITTSKQAEKLAEIGAQFKRIREDKDLSIPHLTATTLISERYLRAIEDGEMGSLPEPIYVRGFIRKYADALGATDLSDDFPLNPILPEQKWAGSAAAELRPLHLYALYVAVIAGAVSLLATLLNSPDSSKINDSQTNFGKAAQILLAKSEKLVAPVDVLLPKTGGLQVLRQPIAEPSAILTPPNLSEAIAPAQALTNASLSQKPLSKSPSENALSESSSILNSKLISWTVSSANAAPNVSAIATNGEFEFIGKKPVNVGIVMKGESWVRIIVDDQTEFEGMLNEGKKLTWSGDRQISVRVGNASSVALSYNNQPTKVMGKEGEIAGRLFSLNSPSAPNQPNSLQANNSSLKRFVEFMANTETPN